MKGRNGITHNRLLPISHWIRAAIKSPSCLTVKCRSATTANLSLAFTDHQNN